MVITTFDGLISARNNGLYDDEFFAKASFTPGVTTNWYTLHRCAGMPQAMAPAAIGSGGTVCSSATAGAIPLVARTSTNIPSIVSWGVNASAINGFTTVMLVDILWAGSGITMNTSTSAQTVSSPGAITRYTNGLGNKIIVADYTTAPGTTSANVTVAYTDGNNQARNTQAYATGVTAANNGDKRTFGGLGPAASNPFMLMDTASADQGVKSVQSVTVSALTGAAGTADVMIVHPLAVLPTIAASTWVEYNATMGLSGIIPLQVDGSNNTACLALLAFANGVNAVQLSGMIRTAYG